MAQGKNSGPTTLSWQKLLWLQATLLASVATAMGCAWGALEVQQRSDEPTIWLAPGFLTEPETHEILQLASTLDHECWERVSSEHSTALLDNSQCYALTESNVMRDVDRRVSDALGVPLSNLEFGYLQRYTANYSAHNVHLDQGDAMHPARVASAIIYLEDQPHGSGHTVFPLRNIASSSAWFTRLWSPKIPQDLVDMWESKLRAGRIINRFFTSSGIGSDIFRQMLRQCAAGLGFRPRRGSALLFRHRTADGRETMAAAHGSCSMASHAPPKHALVKLACDGAIR